MKTNSSQLDTLLADVASGEVIASGPSLDATQLMTVVTARQRQRRRYRVMACSLGCVIVAAGLFFLPSKEGPIAEPVDPQHEWDSIVAELDEIEANIQLAVQHINEHSEPQFDLLDAYLAEQESLKPTLEQMEAEIEKLENKLALDDRQLEWQAERSRSAALRLELANMDAATNPARAAEAYERIASTYPNTRWGEQARLNLLRVFVP